MGRPKGSKNKDKTAKEVRNEYQATYRGKLRSRIVAACNNQLSDMLEQINTLEKRVSALEGKDAESASEQYDNFKEIINELSVEIRAIKEELKWGTK